MLRLLTLGGAAVVEDFDENPSATSVQRRTLALLSALAVAGPVGMSRDRLVALFWPEADSERGRHALTQALYASRRALACDDAFIVNGDVRLNPDRMTSDIGDLDAMLGTGDERAVALYRGPFLDGFFLPGSASFEQWSSMQRSRIEDEVVRALQRLAARDRDAGETARASDWLRRAAGISPLDSRIALQLMEALAASGDRAGAIQHATIHATLLRNELELAPDPAVTAFAQSLRNTPIPASTALAEWPREDSAERTAPAPAVAGPITPTEVSVWQPRVQARRRRLLPGIALIAVVATSLGIVLHSARRNTLELRPLPLQQKVVVAPFRVAGATASLSYLRDGMVELLSTRLADDSSARSVDAGAVLGAWRAAGLAPAMDVPRDTVVRLAARLGAERVVVGGVIGTPSRLVVRATALRVPGGSVAAQATVEGSADSLTALIDRLAARLLLAEAGEDDRLGNHITSSLPALRAFLAGQSAFRRSDYTAAIRNYEVSLQRDSTFGLAALRLAVVADRVDDVDRMRNALHVAWRFRAALAERDDAILLGLAGPRFPAPSPNVDQVTAWQRAADLMPQNAEAWLSLGARLFHDGAVASVPGLQERADRALQRALVIDTTYAPAARLLAQLATRLPSSTAIDTARYRTVLGDSLSPLAPFVKWRIAVAESDTATLRAIRARMGHIGPTNLRAIAMASQFDAAGIDDGKRALDALRARGSTRSHLADLTLGDHSMALNEGRVRDAFDATRALGIDLPASHAEFRLRILDGLYGDGDPTASRNAAEELERLVASSTPAGRTRSSAYAADLCVLAQSRLAAGNLQGALTAASELRPLTAPAEILPVSPEPAACVELLDAALAVASRRRDARRQLAHLDSLSFTPATAGDVASYAPLLIARLHEQLGDRKGALDAVRRRAYMSDWPRYLAPMLRKEGRLSAGVGDPAGAAAAYRGYLALRTSPDAALRAQRDSVQAELGSLPAAPAR